MLNATQGVIRLLSEGSPIEVTGRRAFIENWQNKQTFHSNVLRQARRHQCLHLDRVIEQTDSQCS